jgi:hypothetical protein
MASAKSFSAVTYAQLSLNLSREFLFNKTNRRTNSQIYFCQSILHVSGSSSAHRQEFFRYTFGTGVCHASFIPAFKKDEDGTAVPSWSCLKAGIKPA